MSRRADPRAHAGGIPGFRARGRIRPSLVAALAVLAGVSAAPGSAQEAEDTTAAEPERPFVRGGQFDKPYLTRLAGRVALGGYAEAHARWEREDGITQELGFLAKRFNLFTSTEVSDFVRFGAELEFEEGAEEIKLEFATIDVAIHPSVSLRAGMILSPLGRFNLAHDSPMNEFTDRPPVATELVGVALSEPGLGLFGRVPVGGAEGQLTYELYAVNGFHEGVVYDSPEGTRIPEGRGNFEDSNRSPALVGRLAVSPRPGWEVGLSGHRGAWNRFEEDDLALDDRRDLTILALDFEAEPAGFRLRGEAAAAEIDLPPGMDGFLQSSQRGFYAELLRDFGRGWVPAMPTSHFTAGVRVDAVDFDADARGDSMKQLTVGLNFRPVPDTVLKLDYLRGRSFDAFNNPAEHAGVHFSVATYF